MDLPDIVGLVSGLLAIFTFLTGVTSVRRLTAPANSPPERSAKRHQWLVLAISAPIFLISMTATLAQGLNGSDTGGTQFLLLLIGAVALLLYAFRWNRSIAWQAFLAGCVVLLGGLGFLFGTISVGEEAEGLTAGLFTGAAVGLLAAFFRGPRRTTPVQPPRDHARERQILLLVRERGGEITVAEVAVATELSLDESRDVMDHMVGRGFGHRVATPGGAVLYRFPDLAPRARFGGDRPPV